MPYQYGATVDVLKIVDYPCLANTYAAFFAGGVAGEIRVRLGSAAAGRQSWPVGADDELSCASGKRVAAAAWAAQSVVDSEVAIAVTSP